MSATASSARLAVLPAMLSLFFATGARPEETPAEELSPIRRQRRVVDTDYAAAEAKIREQLQQASKDTQAELRDQLRRLPYAFAPRMLEIARQDLMHEDAFGPLLFCIVKLNSGPEFDSAVNLLREHFRKSRGDNGLNLYFIVPELVSKESAEIDPFLEEMASLYQDGSAAANVRCTLAERMKARAGRSGKPEDVAAAEAALRDVIENFGDVKIQSGPLKDQAQRELDDLCGPRGIGRPAPEIEGVDLRGNDVKLSDYRGRVVVLSFSGHWCGPCRRMHPHLQKLVEQHADAPFTLLEVNSDKDPAAVQGYMDEHGLTWRCFADMGIGGPISTAWEIHSSPRICVIDRQGVIRHKAVEPAPDELASWVAALLKDDAH